MPASYFKSTKTQRGKESEREKESERGARHPRGRAPAHYDRTVRRNDHGLEERYRTTSEELRMARRALREQTQAAQTKLVELQKELTTTQAHAMSLLLEMQAIKTSLAAHEEEPDTASLLASFDNLNTQTLQFALKTCCTLDAADLQVSLHRSSVDTFLEHHPSAVSLLGALLTEAADAALRVQDVLAPLAQAIVTGTLLRTIFIPFAPGLAGTMQDSLLSDLRAGPGLEGIDAARWRSLTYRAVSGGRDDSELAGAIASEIIEMLSELLRAVLPPGNFESGQLVDQYAAAVGLVSAALRWQDAVRGCSISVEYDVFMPLPGELFVQSDMHAVELLGGQLGTRTQTATRVLLPVSLGLRSTNLVERQSSVLRQANVVGNARV